MFWAQVTNDINMNTFFSLISFLHSIKFLLMYSLCAFDVMSAYANYIYVHSLAQKATNSQKIWCKLDFLLCLSSAQPCFEEYKRKYEKQTTFPYIFNQYDLPHAWSFPSWARIFILHWLLNFHVIMRETSKKYSLLVSVWHMNTQAAEISCLYWGMPNQIVDDIAWIA